MSPPVTPYQRAFWVAGKARLRGQFVERLLGEAAESVRRQFPTPRHLDEAATLIESVCEEEGISSEELRSGRRRRPVVRARALLALRLVTEWGIGQTEAARLLGMTTPAVAKALMRVKMK